MACPQCRSEASPEGARFCSACGAPLAGAPARPARAIEARMEVGSIQGGKATGLEIGSVAGDVTIESTVHQIEAKIVEGDYVDRRTITHNVLVLGPGALDEIAARLAAAQGVDRQAVQRPGAQDLPQHVSRQIAELVAAQREVAARGVPTSAAAAYHLGLLAAADRDHEAALEYLRQATRADPERGDAFEAIAWLQQSLAMDDLTRRDLAAAEARLADAREAAMHTDPLDAGALSQRAYIAKTQAQVAEAAGRREDRDRYLADAARLFEQAARLAPGDASAQNGLGNVQHALGDLDAAIAAYERAIALAPEYASAHHDLALAYEDKMRADPEHAAAFRSKAIAAWRATYALAPDDPGFSADHVVTIGRRLRSLEHQAESERN